MRIARKMRLPALLLAFGLVATACSSDDDGGDDETTGTETTDEGAQDDGGDASQSTLSIVQDRGNLVCGVNGSVPGFSFVDEDGNWSGFDVDYCKAVAAAVLDDPEAVEYRALTADERFTALQSREIDVLIRNTTWTATRDGSEGATFALTTFYDGQGMMVRSDSEFESLDDMDGTTICVLSGTTTELNLATVFEARGLAFEPLSFQDNETLQQAFEEGRCDGWTSDKSQLAGVRSNFSEGPEALTILDETMSKEPLGPVTRDGDSEWSQAVNWVVISTIQAEEFGLTSDNIADADTENPEIARFVGEEGFDPGLGLPADVNVRVVEAVGNYGEIYERHVGPDTPLGLPRGLNALWTDGGLLYPPPYR